MDNNTIETLSINAVRNSIVMSNYLNQFIADNDKEPSWDGFVYIYGNESKSKDTLTGRMPVQVKGTQNNDFSKNDITFPVKVSDLKNYLYDGGVVFFVVYINDSGDNKIYYSALPPIKLRSILEDAKQQKTKKIVLKAFPSSGDEKANIFLNCWNHCRKQSSFVDAKLHTLEELEAQGVLEGITTSVSGYGIGEHDMPKALVSSEAYMYAQIKGSSIPQPLDFIPLGLQTSMEMQVKISINNIIYYHNCMRVYSNGKTTIKIGQSFTITYFDTKTRTRINYSNSSKLRILVKDLDFLLAVIETGHFEYNENMIPIDFTQADVSNFDMGQQKKMLVHLKRMVQMFDMLGATSDIDLAKLTLQDEQHINQLIIAFADKRPVSGLKADLSPVLRIKISDFRFLLAFLPIEGQYGTYNIHDFFKTECQFRFTDPSGNSGEMSQYAMLKSNDFLELTNTRFEVLLPSFQKLKDCNQKFSQANFTMLELLTAYDTCKGKSPILLKTAMDFTDWLMEVDQADSLPYYVRLLNKLQVIRRQREFVPAEINQLCGIIENSDSNEEAIVGAYLLLGDQPAAEIHFDKLEHQRKENFRSYPIYHFWDHTPQKT